MTNPEDRSGGSLPASEEGTGMILEDEGRDDALNMGVSESEAGTLTDDRNEAQSWPGTSFGSIPPPGWVNWISGMTQPGEVRSR